MEYKQELPEEVDVETITFVAFSDGRPTETIVSGTLDPSVRLGKLNSVGQQLLSQFLVRLVALGVSEWTDDDGTTG